VAGEGQNYHETRDPYFQSGDFTAVTVTTGQSIVPVLRVPATALAFPAGYWEKPGRRWVVYLYGRATTGATPGNFTFEIRWQSGTPSDAGGTILATSAATAFTATKTSISWWMRFFVESRGDASTFVPTASPLFAMGMFQTDGTSALITSPGNPMMIPAATAAAVNVDTTLAGTLRVDAKRSGSTAETIQVHDLIVNSLT
jgi:hypothetical protein